MQRLAACAIALAPALAGAQGFPGAKSDPISTPASSASAGGFGPLFNVLIALGIVYALMRFALPKAIARMNRRIVAGVGSAIRIEESASFAGGSLYVVSARRKTLLLSVNGQGVQCLADLTEASPEPLPPTFAELIDEQVTTPTAVVQDHDVSEALRRLERLAV